MDPVTQVELVVPAFANEERAIRRAGRQRDGALRVIRFYPDWPHIWPLWDEELGAVSADDLGFSSELQHDLRQWFDYWNATFTHHEGWPSSAAGDVWTTAGDVLVDRLQQEVWDFTEVRAEHHTTPQDTK
ncbi:hypothetical protein JF66_18805 [Cryobacterium sp. MLB-32]|nr:hypothetical protein JF66_18805 [Cryobacterium sp. MLB-32]